jgi:V/A-type H+-transporting ATPase subunit E
MTRTLGDITKELKDGIIEPAKDEAAKILSEAQKEAEAIKAEAHKQAEETVSQAKTSAEQTKKQMEADMDTAARNFMLKMQESLESAVVSPVLSDEIRKTVSAPGFLPKMIEHVLEAYAKSIGQEARIELLLPEKQKKELEAWCLEKCGKRMFGHVDVHFTDKINFGFKLGVQGSGNQFNFSGGLIEAFSDFCSPRFRRHFFASKEK